MLPDWRQVQNLRVEAAYVTTVYLLMGNSTYRGIPKGYIVNL